MVLNVVPLARMAIFGALLIFSLIVLGVDGHLVSTLSASGKVCSFGFCDSYSFSAPSWAKLGVATSVLTLVSLIAFLAIDFFRKGAPTSWVVVELAWLGLLWILWLATAADTASNVDCNGISGNNICSQAQAGEAFSFLAWIALMAYWVLLLVFAIRAHSGGHPNIWQASTTETDFTSPNYAGGAHHAGAQPTTTAYPGSPATYETKPPVEAHHPQQQQQQYTGTPV